MRKTKMQKRPKSTDTLLKTSKKKDIELTEKFERHPLDRTVRWRTVANELSMTLVVRRCFQCSAGKS